MKKAFAAAALGIGMVSAAALAGAPAHAAPSGKVTASYGCQSATFTNNSGRTATVTYGYAGSESNKSVTLSPGASKSVKATLGESKSFGWMAKTANGTEVGLEDYPGVNLLKHCSGTGSSKPSTGGLAKTGV
ncbi:hypothetical protein CGZ95_09995 [Enemella evansiae]|uniref:hypothetical protein n=1 Tax=Enemella evansiae TaxID=2016499 RepID=UPI000B962A96|nr:hypothetical protein [Enemella evansiae]OYO00926.1 hypothetical protein CGZ95_09995 [Enemella evansiae]